MKQWGISVCSGVALSLAASWGHAYEMGTYEYGLLVPNVVHNGVSDTTAVGLIADGCGVPEIDVYWTFFDNNSKHVTDGVFRMTNSDVYAFVWAEHSGLGLEGTHGYLTFFVDTNGDGALDPRDVPAGKCLAAEAFHVVAADNDVAYVPVWPVRPSNLNGGQIPDLTILDKTTLVTLQEGAQDRVGAGGNETLVMRYSISNGDTTDIVVWSAESIGGPNVLYTVNMFDDEENRKSLNYALPNEEQNIIDPAAITGRPANFVNGFIEWATPDDALGQYTNTVGGFEGTSANGIVSYSVIRSSGFSARQTVLNPHHP